MVGRVVKCDSVRSASIRAVASCLLEVPAHSRIGALTARQPLPVGCVRVTHCHAAANPEPRDDDYAEPHKGGPGRCSCVTSGPIPYHLREGPLKTAGGAVPVASWRESDPAQIADKSGQMADIWRTVDAALHRGTGATA